jgi:hypothetical protein
MSNPTIDERTVFGSSLVKVRTRANYSFKDRCWRLDGRKISPQNLIYAANPGWRKLDSRVQELRGYA